MSPAMKDIYYRLDYLVAHGNPEDQELAMHLIHEIDDYGGRNRKWRGSTAGLDGTQSATSTSMSVSRKIK